MSQNLEYRQRKDLSLNVPNFESITLEVKTHESGILFCTIYRPPNSSDRDFLKNYARLLKKFTPQQEVRLIIGLDHNLDLIKLAKHRVTNEFIELNLENQMLPTITKPTRITRTTATLLDNINVLNVIITFMLLVDHQSPHHHTFYYPPYYMWEC